MLKVKGRLEGKLWGMATLPGFKESKKDWAKARTVCWLVIAIYRNRIEQRVKKHAGNNLNRDQNRLATKQNRNIWLPLACKL